MSGPDSIDALVVARRVLAQPKTFRLSNNETLAMAGCLVGLDEQLDDIETKPVVGASLAAAIAAFIAADEALEASRTADGYLPLPKLVARRATFNALKTTFEKEFPHD